jgi:hypothetical protein
MENGGDEGEGAIVLRRVELGILDNGRVVVFVPDRGDVGSSLALPTMACWFK